MVWLNAESADTIAAGFRRLANDTGFIVKDMDNQDIVNEMLARLYRTKSVLTSAFCRGHSCLQVPMASCVRQR